MRSLKQREQEIITIYGQKIPRWKDCPECKSKLSCKFQFYGYEVRCLDCQMKKNKKEERKNKRITSYHKGYKEPEGFLNTSRGLMGFNAKGEIFDPKETRYDLQKDPHGWEATGKKVRKKEKRRIFI